MKVEIEKIWDKPGCGHYQNNNKRWTISTLWELSKELPVQEMSMSALNIGALGQDIKTVRDLVGHIKNVLDADMSYPIILNDDGQVMDGRHRIMKALLEGHDTIKFVRFNRTPYGWTINNQEHNAKNKENST